jgi:hypothetical protein
VRSQAADVVAMLGDPARCQVLLVTLPEELPTTELIEAAYFVEDRAGVRLGPIVVNGYPDVDPLVSVPVERAALEAHVELGEGERASLEAARAFTLHRAEVARAQVDRLAAELALPQIHLPWVEGGRVGRTELGALATAFERTEERTGGHGGA